MNIINRFINSAILLPENIALEVNDQKYSYRQLGDLGKKLGTIILQSTRNEFIGILAYRSLSVYGGILGALAAGKCYIPFNPKFPLNRILKIIEMTGCDTFIVDKNFAELIQSISASVDRKLTFIFIEDFEFNPGNDKKSVFISRSMIDSSAPSSPVELDPSASAYLLFTSGSTGEPKGIPISHRNLAAYIDFVQDKYPLVSQDRCSQAFDTTFDPSVHDIWVTWNAGASLVVVPELHLLNPVKFIQNKNLTVWYSVPSIGLFVKRLRMLKPGIFPQLRFSIFSGEALPADFAEAWQQAAPNSVLINYYGPTEITINITDYAWDSHNSMKITENNIVPIGSVFPTHKYLIIDEQLKPVAKGSIGELIISGIQVCNGYFKNPEKTKENFIFFEGRDEPWYRTGDLVKELPDSCLLFSGRKDAQVKIRGYRVELVEIEGRVKNLLPENEIRVLAHPVKDNIAEGIICFISGHKTKEDPEILKALSESLPSYMVPNKLIYIKEFPLNVNGKINNQELIKSHYHG
jgi:amino acid adenylation domain-containing protein